MTSAVQYEIPAYSFLHLEGVTMRTISYSESRANYSATLDAVLDDREEVIVTRAGKEPVVIVALSDYESLKEAVFRVTSS